tara:strand:- start:1599 stop:1706 length:108 start_codon:yes stop_codon:yes gene_type:complete
MLEHPDHHGVQAFDPPEVGQGKTGFGWWLGKWKLI